MKKVFKKAILISLLFLTLSTLLLTWQNYSNVQVLNGTQIISGNLLLSTLIIVLYLGSVLFYEKARKLLFCSGLCSLSMLFALLFSRFESWGGFANENAGPYLGLSCILITIATYIVWNIRENK